MRRCVISFFLALTGLSALLGLAIYVLLRSSLPSLSGEYPLNGLQSAVTI